MVFFFSTLGVNLFGGVLYKARVFEEKEQEVCVLDFLGFPAVSCGEAAYRMEVR